MRTRQIRRSLNGWLVVGLLVGLAAGLLAACGDSTPGLVPNTPSTATAGGPFWIPFSATPTATGGRNGLFVVPSTSPGSTPAFVASGSVGLLGAASQPTLRNAAIKDVSPAVILFAANDSTGTLRVYGLDLRGTTEKPVARRVSNLALSGVSSESGANLQMCGATAAQTDLAIPTTLFALIQVGTSQSCDASTDTYYLVRYTDASTAAPQRLATPLPNIFYVFPLYEPSGALGGFWSWDYVGGFVYYYRGDAIDSPQVLVSNVKSFTPFYQNIPGPEFFAYSQPSAATQLIQLNPNGSTVPVYTSSVGLGVAPAVDGANFFFSDGQDGTVWQESHNGGAPTKLFTGLDSYSLIASSGSQLLTATATGHISVELATIPLGTFSTSSTPLLMVTDSVQAFYQPASGGNSANDLLFLTWDLPLDPFIVAPHTVNTEVLRADGTQLSAMTPNTEFQLLRKPSGDDVFEVIGATGPLNSINEGNEGGLLNRVDVPTLALTPVTNPDGSPYTLPPGGVSGFQPLSKSISAWPPTIGIGSSPPTSPGSGLVLDSSSNVVYTINLANTAINLFWQ